VLEAGCGGGQHTSLIAAHAASVTAVDLNTAEIANKRNTHLKNIVFVQDDIAAMDLKKQFDVVICVGVIHHTNDPDKTFQNLYRHVKPGGQLVIWTYSAAGNFLMKYFIEPFRKKFLSTIPSARLFTLSRILTVLLYPWVFTVYRIPALKFLPYYEYFRNFRRLSFYRNSVNVFDKLNAPQTQFMTREKCLEWFNADLFDPESISISPYVGVSYTLVGVKKQ
jgi:SAM-dependent methyltransferase